MQTVDRLKVLYTLKCFKNPISKNKIVEFFTHNSIFSRKEIEILINDLNEVNLINIYINNSETIIDITENGSVVLSFFKNRLDSKLIENIEYLVSKSDMSPKRYKTHHFYESFDKTLNINVSMGNEIIFSMKIQMSFDDYLSLIENIDKFGIDEIKKINSLVFKN